MHTSTPEPEEFKKFDEMFPGLKSVGHKKIHFGNHSSHKGSGCTDKCVYVSMAIKTFIKENFVARSVVKDIILDIITGVDWIEEPKSAMGMLNKALAQLTPPPKINNN